MLSLAFDFRYALRVLRRYPVVSIIAVPSLALGIAANSTMFSLVDAMYLRSFAVADPAGLVWVAMRTAEGQRGGMAWLEYLEAKASAPAFADIAVQNRRGTMIEKDGVAELVPLTIVSDNYFALLGVKPARGRLFEPTLDAGLAGQPAVALSDGAWRRYFGADPDIVGKSVRMANRAFTVVGVLPPEFRGLDREVATGVWVPVVTWKAMNPGNAREFEDRGGGQFEGVARLRPGSSMEQAAAQLDTVSRRLEQDYPGTNRGRRIVAYTEAERQSGGGPAPTLLLLSVVGIVLLIACANVAMLLLAQAEGREREISIRLSVGATQWRVVRQLLTEGAVLALAAGALVFLVISWMIPLIPALLPPGPEFMKYDIRMDRRVVLVTVLSCVATVFLFGLAPALSSARRDLMAVLKGRGFQARRSHAGRYVLVAGQAALTVLLITAAALLARSFQNTLEQRIGFDTDRNTLVLNSGLEAARDRVTATCEEIVERVRTLPGIRQAAYARRIPLGLFGGGATRDVVIPGNTAAGVLRLRYNQVSEDYFAAMGTRILAGRGFARSDGAAAALVAIVSQTMQRRFWPAADAIGQHIRVDDADTEIVGVAEDGVIENVPEVPEPFLFFPFAQAPVREVTFVVEAAGDASQLMTAVKREMRAANPGIMFFVATTLKQQVKDARYSSSVLALLSAVVGGLGLLLAAGGLFGVVLQGVNRRTREMGVRMALGADRRTVMTLVIRHGLVLAGAGAVVGAAASLASGRLIAGLLYGMSPYDPIALLFSVAAVLLVAVVASAYPAWKATRIDPAEVLRAE